MTIELTTYQGECKYCGNIQPIMAMDQIDANEKISEECPCCGAERARRKAALMRNLENTIGKNAAESGFKPVEPEQEELINTIAIAVFDGYLQGVTCKIDGSAVTITGGIKIKVKRVDTKTQQLEA